MGPGVSGDDPRAQPRTTPSTGPQEGHPVDPGAFAPPIETVPEDSVREGPAKTTVEGRRLQGPSLGFGQLWEKRFHARFRNPDLRPAQVMAAWKDNFHHFWPQGNRFYPPAVGIAPGAVGVGELVPAPGVKLSFGLLVLYADEESFTFLTAQGHMFAGWVTFSCAADDGRTTAQVRIQMRANDPLYELGLLLGGHSTEERFWVSTLMALGRHFGEDLTVQSEATLLDPHRQWRRAANIRYNAFILTTLHRLVAPLRWLRGWLRG